MINNCIYHKLKNNTNLLITLTLLLETGSKGLDLKEHFMFDVKIGRASNYVQFLDMSDSVTGNIFDS